MSINYTEKYLKYKTKYLNLKSRSTIKQTGGGPKPEIYLFKATWCGHCKQFAPIWDALQNDTDLKSKYVFKTIDSDADKQTIKDWKIEGFPTIIKKDGNNAIEYVGDRTADAVKSFLIN